MMVTNIGALLCTTVAKEAPIITTALFQNMWKIPMLIAPIPISDGRSFFFTWNNFGLRTRIPKKRRIDVVRSLQKANPTAERPLFLTIRLMKIPEVDQHIVAATTSRVPESLVEIGLFFVFFKSLSFPLRERVSCLQCRTGGIEYRYPGRPVLLFGQVSHRV